MQTTETSPLTLYVNTALKAWNLHANRLSDLFDSLTDDELRAQVAPGRNTGFYLLGHLVTVHDGILPLIGDDKKQYPELHVPFLVNGDQPLLDYNIDDLRKYWKAISEKLIQRFSQITPEEWLTRHNSVSPEDFAKEPHRNKLSILISRTTHMAYHHGQLVFLKEKKAD